MSESSELNSPTVSSTVAIVRAQNDTSANSDDEDSDARNKNKDRRREAHTHAEQKRRDAIKKGYEALVDVVPTCQQADAVGSTKLSKASILQKSIDYVEYLVKNKKKQEDELEKLRRDVVALKIMKANYEHIVKANKNQQQVGADELPEEIKFRVFQHFMDNLFISFNNSISVDNFAELSATAFNWLEEFCKPQVLKEFMLASAHRSTVEYRQ